MSKAPSPSLLFYLFADRILPEGGLFDAVAIPGRWAPNFNLRHGTVTRQPLCELLLCSALWSLREQGAVELKVVSESTWTKSVEVRYLADRHLGLLEGGLLDFLAERRHREVRAFHLCHPNGGPRMFIVDVLREGIDLGLIEGAALADSAALEDIEFRRFEIDDRAVADLMSDFEAIHGAFSRFQREEPDVYRHLLRECRAVPLSNEYGETVGIVSQSWGRHLWWFVLLASLVVPWALGGILRSCTG